MPCNFTHPSLPCCTDQIKAGASLECNAEERLRLRSGTTTARLTFSQSSVYTRAIVVVVDSPMNANMAR